MAKVFDVSKIVNLGTLVPPYTTGTNALATWTSPTGVVYTLKDGLHRPSGGVNEGEVNDNVKFQTQPDGTVYMYTVHNNITATVNDPDTKLNETTQHTGIVTYAIDRDATTGAISARIVHIQDQIKDAAGNWYSMGIGAGNSPYLEQVSTSNGSFLVVKYDDTSTTSRDYDGDGDRDILNSIATYSIGSNGTPTPVDAKIWDTQGNDPPSATGLTNTNPGTAYAGSSEVNSHNFSVLKAPDGTPVIMQEGTASTTGNLISLNSNGTFGKTTTINYPATAGTTNDEALNNLFDNASNYLGGTVSVTVGGKTFVYTVSGSEVSARAQLTLDTNGNPQLSNFAYSTDNQSTSVFTGGTGVHFTNAGQPNIVAVPDIGDGKKYVFVGDVSTWQFFEVRPDGLLAPASTTAPRNWIDASSTGSFYHGQREGISLINYEVGGTTYTGWLQQHGSTGDQRWLFYNPKTGYIDVTGQNLSPSEEPSTGERGHFTINGHGTWIVTQNNSKAVDVAKSGYAYVTDGGQTKPLYCFASGTRILTGRGNVAIENLRVGDMVQTLDNGLQPIRWIRSRKVSAWELSENPKLRPIHISAGALGHNIPHRDVQVSAQHRVMLRSKLAQHMFDAEEVLVSAKNLVDVPGIFVTEPGEGVEYFHLMFDEHEILFANGMYAESMLAGEEALKNLPPEALEELYAIFPELRLHHGARKSAKLIVLGRKIHKYVERRRLNNKPLSL